MLLNISPKITYEEHNWFLLSTENWNTKVFTLSNGKSEVYTFSQLKRKQTPINSIGCVKQ